MTGRKAVYRNSSQYNPLFAAFNKEEKHEYVGLGYTLYVMKTAEDFMELRKHTNIMATSWGISLTMHSLVFALPPLLGLRKGRSPPA